MPHGPGSFEVMEITPEPVVVGDSQPELVPGPHGQIGVLAAVLEVKRGMLPGVARAGEHAQDFMYRKADDVVDGLAALLVEHGLILVPDVSVGDRHHFVTNRGNNDSLLMHSVTYRLYFTDGSSLIGRVAAQAQGNTGYATGAAMSYAYKYFMSQVFNIPFQDQRMELDALEADNTIAAQASPPQDDYERAGWKDQAAHDTAMGQLREHMARIRAESDAEGPESAAARARATLRTFLEKVGVLNTEGHLTMMSTQQWAQIVGELQFVEPFAPEPANTDGEPRGDRAAQLGEVMVALGGETDWVTFDELVVAMAEVGIDDPLDVTALTAIGTRAGWLLHTTLDGGSEEPDGIRAWRVSPTDEAEADAEGDTEPKAAPASTDDDAEPSGGAPADHDGGGADDPGADDKAPLNLKAEPLMVIRYIADATAGEDGAADMITTQQLKGLFEGTEFRPTVKRLREILDDLKRNGLVESKERPMRWALTGTAADIDWSFPAPAD